jgi:hypothetical protein
VAVTPPESPCIYNWTNHECGIQDIVKPGSTPETLLKASYPDLKTLTQRDIVLYGEVKTLG